MTPERALWQAVATVAIPTLIIWGVLLYALRENANPDEWPLYIIFIALPLPLIFPIYKRYLRGPSVRVEKPRTLFIAAAVSVALGSTYVGFSILHHRDNSDLAFHLAVGAGWLLIGGEKLRRALKARSNKSPVVNVEQFH
jgi:hypothetical protein